MVSNLLSGLTISWGKIEGYSGVIIYLDSLFPFDILTAYTYFNPTISSIITQYNLGMTCKTQHDSPHPTLLHPKPKI